MTNHVSYHWWWTNYPLTRPGKHTKSELENCHWNSGFTQLENGDFPLFFVCLPEGIHNISTYVGTVDAIDRIVPCISKVKALCPKPAYVLSSRPISSPAFQISLKAIRDTPSFQRKWPEWLGLVSKLWSKHVVLHSRPWAQRLPPLNYSISWFLVEVWDVIDLYVSISIFVIPCDHCLILRICDIFIDIHWSYYIIGHKIHWYTYICSYTYVYTYVYIYILIYIYMCVCICVGIIRIS